MAHIDNYPDTFTWSAFAEAFEGEGDPCDDCVDKYEWEMRDNPDDGVEDCPHCEDCERSLRWETRNA